MKLPSLPDLDIDLDSDLEEFTDEDVEYVKKVREKAKKASTPKKSLPDKKTQSRKAQKDKEIKRVMEEKEVEDKKKKPRIPKTQYDAEGNPLLAIPDLDDIDLSSELDRFFGEEDD